jgi:dTDP-4-dehydrorhamnose reductase
VPRLTVALTGATGQLGRALIDAASEPWEIHGIGSDDLDVTDGRGVRDWLAFLQPDLVIHAAAATNVDRCEREPDFAFTVNALGTRNVARAAAATGAGLVYVSTNFVFDGFKAEPYHEFDSPSPISVYGASKLAGEIECWQAQSNCHIIRTAMVFAREGTNFVNTMLRLMAERDELTVVDDQFGNPTSARDLARGIVEVVDRAPYGTYHLTNSGSASWYEWALAVKEIVQLDCNVRPIPAAGYERDATPPANGRLQSLILPDLGITLPSWQDALRRCLDE